MLRLKEKKLKKLTTNKLSKYYPDTGPLRRDLYKKHTAFFKSGLYHRQRLFLAANRIGKSEGVGGYEVACHLTGKYPKWWNGRTFNSPVRVWVAGDNNLTTRDICQNILLGPYHDMGTGLIPKEYIARTTNRAGVPEGVDTAYISHINGGFSTLGFKSYDQKRKSFQGTAKDVIWLDEEPPADIYDEALTRTVDTGGMMILTFTPLLGMSTVVLKFLKSGAIPKGEVKNGSKYVIMAGWDDAPHLIKEVKEELEGEYLPYQRKARTKGIPQLGSGAIYPIDEDDVLIPDFEIPRHWPRVYGMDVGWNWTVAMWAAWDRDTDTLYLSNEYYRAQAEPEVHAAGIKSRGSWIPGVIDPASKGRNQKDGSQLLEEYKDLGLNLETANNSVEAGILAVYKRMTTGKLKIFKSCVHWISEFRLYRRNEKGLIVKENDHLMDSMRYLVMSGMQHAIIEPEDEDLEIGLNIRSEDGWMG